MDIVSISAAITAVRETLSLVKSAADARDEAKVTAATVTLTEKIMDVQSAALALQEKMSEMRDEIETLKAEKRALRQEISDAAVKQSTSAEYQLAEVGKGFYAYKYIGTNKGVPAHHACVKCFQDKGKHYPLSSFVHAMTESPCLYCNTCKTTLYV